eukprot:c32952_g1_i1 orf=21-581(+)
MASEFMKSFRGRLTRGQFLSILGLEGDKQQALRFFIWASKQKYYKHGYEAQKKISELWGHKPQFRDFLRVLDQSRDPEFQITDATFTLLMKGYGWAGMFESALHTFHNLKVAGCTPNVIHFTCLIDVLVKSHQVDTALSYFNEMVEHGCPPNVYTYNSIMVGLCESNDVRRACALMNDMKQKGCTP